MTTQNIEPENSDINETVVQQSSVSETPTTSADAEVAMPANEQVTQTQETEIKTSDQQIDEEPLRSFTDYIEEFRQKEVQFGSLLEEPQVEPFSALIPAEAQGGSEFTPGWENTPFGESTLLEGTPFAVEDVEDHSSAQNVLPVESYGATESAQLQVLPEEQAPVPEQVLPAAEIKATSPAELSASPFLRSSSRVRLPRNSGLRQRDESEGEGQAQQNVETEIITPPSVVDTSQEEKPRPERRYRFDRRTPATSTEASPAQLRTEESVGTTTSPQAFTRTDNGHAGEREEQVKQLSGVAQSTEQLVPAQAVVQEQAVTQTAETEKGKPTKTTHDARRRHGQERQRDKVQATPAVSVPAVSEVAAPVTEISVPQVPEVALEDLPPLEYADLQAANSRRRRRRRTSSSSQVAMTTNAPANPDVAKSVTPEQTVTGAQIPSSPSPVSPATVIRSIAVPGSSVPSDSQYSIQSGHTVSQMNQGNGVSGPFMGPEPSPARGSGSSMPRSVRPIRNEVQHVPAYSARTEGAASSASINHLANVVAQAIQTQSDRMAAELRRANQIPTNVSVSLPPYPSTERVGVFVDVANLLYSARTQRLTIDFGKLLDFLRGNRRLVRAHAYCPTSPQPGDDQMFLQAVKGLGYRITTKNYKTFSSGAKKADLDLDLCMDVVRLVDGRAVDCIVLVSGDSDFMPMLDYCSDHGVRVEVAAFDESMSATLRQGCDLFINLSMLDEIRA